MQKLSILPRWFLRRRLLRELHSRIDLDTFSKIHDRYQSVSPDPGFSKYLDLKTWLNINLGYALHLGLHRRPSASILDLGTGCGYFPFICRFFGHSVQTIDVDEVSMYRELTGLLQIPRTLHKITAFQPLPEFHTLFDVVTAFMISFNNHKQPDLWKEREWSFLLDDLTKRCAPKARVFFVLNQEADGKFCSAEIKSLFEKRGALVKGSFVDFMNGIHPAR